MASDTQTPRAAEEGRSVQVQGIPPGWSLEQLHDFFSFQGTVDSVSLLPVPPDQKTRNAVVNFATADEATNTAQVCDDLPVDDADGNAYRLSCQIKKEASRRVDYTTGYSQLSQARMENRCLYISGMHPEVDEAQVRLFLEPHGAVEEVVLLPAGAATESCFASMCSAEDAETVVQELDGRDIAGKILAVGYPRPPKRQLERRSEDPNLMVEIRGFPFATSSRDISTAIEAGISHRVQLVQVLQNEHGQGGSYALVRMESADDARAVVDELNGFGFMPGYALQVRLKAFDTAPAIPSSDAGKRPRVPSQDGPVPSAVCPLWQGQESLQAFAPPKPRWPAGGKGGPRCKGRVVGQLVTDGAAYVAEVSCWS